MIIIITTSIITIVTITTIIIAVITLHEYYRYPSGLRQAHVAILLLLDEGTSMWFRV